MSLMNMDAKTPKQNIIKLNSATCKWGKYAMTMLVYPEIYVWLYTCKSTNRIHINRKKKRKNSIIPSIAIESTFGKVQRLL